MYIVYTWNQFHFLYSISVHLENAFTSFHAVPCDVLLLSNSQFSKNNNNHHRFPSLFKINLNFVFKLIIP